MHTYKPIRAALLVYDIFRIAVLALMFASLSPLKAGLFPHLVYLTPNALFPLMALFLLIRLPDFKSYLPLYLAGKIIAVITFYVWGIVSFGSGQDTAYLEMNQKYPYVLFFGSFVLSLGDLLSIVGSWVLLNKIYRSPRPDNVPAAAGNNGG